MTEELQTTINERSIQSRILFKKTVFHVFDIVTQTLRMLIERFVKSIKKKQNKKKTQRTAERFIGIRKSSKTRSIWITVSRHDTQALRPWATKKTLLEKHLRFLMFPQMFLR